MKNSGEIPAAPERVELGSDVWYSPETGFVMRDVSRYVPEQTTRRILDEDLYPKNEYHVTLLNTRRYIGDSIQESDIVSKIQNYLQTCSLSEIDIASCKKYLCQRGDAVSVIALVGDDDAMMSLKDLIRTLIPDYEQLSHVTLLTNKTAPLGIAVPNDEFLSKNAVEIDTREMEQHGS